MRRLLAAAVALATVVGAALLAAGCASKDTSGYRVDAIFDNAGFLTNDTDVRIGGAKVGKVKDLTLTRDHRARVEMEIGKKFAPFRGDADCTIQPQSLISEKFVNCTPGTPDAPALRSVNGVATLPVQNTHAPIDIDLLLNIFDRPVRERLTLLLSALGTGLAARGEDLNQTILRAAPALQETRRVLRILDADKTQLQDLIGNSDVVLKSLAAGRDRVAEFVRSTGEVAAVSGQRRRNLAAAVHELPRLLAQARGGLSQLTAFAKVGTPFAERLRASGPGLDRLTRQLAPFAKQVTPTVTRLGVTARRAQPALKDIAPQARRLDALGRNLPQVSSLLSDLFTSSRDNGVSEGLGDLGYYATASLARFDEHSHILPSYLILSPCAIYATSPTPGCDAHYAASATQRARYYRALDAAKAKRKRAHEKGDRPTAEKPAQSAPIVKIPDLPKKVGSIPLPDLPKVIGDVLGTVKDVLGAGKQQQPKSDQQQNAVSKLLDFLLGT